jgi:DNA-binding beta-propeller fold protein YncE
MAKRRATYGYLLAAAVAVAVIGCNGETTTEPEAPPPTPPKPEFLGKWGSKGSGDGEFNYPLGVAVAPNGDVYVADTGNNRAQYFTASGKFKGKWGEQGAEDGQFEAPSSIGVGPDGNVYVADAENSRIQYFTPTGSFLGKWDPELYYPDLLEVGSGNGNVYVSEYGDATYVRYYDRTGDYLGEWRIQARDEWAYIVGLGCGPDGTLYVSVFAGLEYYETRIEKYTASGSFVGYLDTRFSPSDSAVATEGDYIYVDGSNYGIDDFHIDYYDVTGSYINSWGKTGSGDGEFKEPRRLATAAGHLIYVADSGNDRVQYFGFTE